MYKRFLVPVDGSETSNKALVTALQMARDSGGAMRLVHLENELASLGMGEVDPSIVEELLELGHSAAQKVIADATAIAESAGVAVDSRLVTAMGERLGNVVAREATDWNADLIVLGSHGRRGIGRVLLGSGAEQIIRMAPVPVLVIRSDTKPASSH
ncbi:MAG: universal stress protein [Pseudomonadota bacterium]